MTTSWIAGMTAVAVVLSCLAAGANAAENERPLRAAISELEEMYGDAYPADRLLSELDAAENASDPQALRRLGEKGVGEEQSAPQPPSDPFRYPQTVPPRPS